MKKYLSILFVLLLTNVFAKEELIVYIPGGYGDWLEKATVSFEKKNNVDVTAKWPMYRPTSCLRVRKYLNS